jgi:hypothetical protein
MKEENRFVKLSRKDVSEGVERKGNLDFLSWGVAWTKLCEDYPGSTYFYGEKETFPDGSVMVEVGVTVEGLTHVMRLPVMDNRNKSILNPSSRDVSDANMRCLVKAIAMHGAGLSLYTKVKGLVDETPFDVVSRLIDSGDHSKFHEYVTGLDERTRTDLFNGAAAGQKTKFKDSYRGALRTANLFFDSVSETVSEAREQDDLELLAESIGELTAYEKGAVWARLSPEDQQFIQQNTGK